MSDIYSTGELAKAAGVSVRMVQYYDKRELLKPSQVTEGGRRLYTEAELNQLKVIVFLKDLDFSLEQIKRVLSEKNVDQVLSMLLTEHIKELKMIIEENKEKLDTSVKLLDRLQEPSSQPFSILSELSISMKNQKQWRRLQMTMWLSLISVIIMYVGTILLSTYFQQR